MPEEGTSTTAASEDASTTAGTSDAGSTNDGSAGGTQGESGTLDTSTENADQARVRAEQSRADKAESELAKALARVKQLEAPATPPTTTDTQVGVTMADLVRMDSMRETRDLLRTEFPAADPALSQNYLAYDSPEAMRVAVSLSHADRVADNERRDKESEERVRKQYAAKFGELPAEVPPGSDPGAGLPTLAQISNMSMAERTAYDEKNPGVIADIMSKSMGSAPIQKVTS